MLLVLASAIFLGSESLGLEAIFYCLRFETSPFVTSYNSQGHGGGIRLCLHTGISELTAHSMDSIENTASIVETVY
jgi:hypothetical protein